MDVKISWNWLEWNEGYKWKKDIIPQLNDYGIPEHELNRCVYVVRSNSSFTIRYPKKNSPTLYIGQGNFKDRLTQHRNWLKELIELVGEFPFLIAVCIPRVRNNTSAYRDLEAALIIEFKSEYGYLPLMNKRMQNRLCDYKYVPEQEFRSVLLIGKGVRYDWALEPMPSNRFYDAYYKTA